jgi:dTDP-4-amino-4,6-dideoxygalactose transaminase
MSDEPIPLAIPSLEGNAARYLQECLDTKFVSSVGPFVGRFETEFASYTGSPYAVACSNGTAAIHVALRVAGVGQGDDVLVSDFTFIATVNPISYVDAHPVLVDADPATWNISAELVVDELDRRARAGLKLPKAVLVAHILGLPADLSLIVDRCEKYGVCLIEDAAEALGARYDGGRVAKHQVGTVGVLGCFSFNGNKIITTGGGGMVATSDPALARRAKHLTTQARLPGADYIHDEVGYNYRLTNLAAALGVAQLERLDSFIQRKRAIARRYDEALAAIPGITTPPSLPWARPTFWLYSVLIDPAVTGVDRRTVQRALSRAGINTRSLWAPAHLMSFHRDTRRIGGAVGEMLFARGLSLPCSVSLTDTQQGRVIEAFTGILASPARPVRGG